MTSEELNQELAAVADSENERELELERLKTCYMYASSDDRKVIWAALNKYVPFLASQSLI